MFYWQSAIEQKMQLAQDWLGDPTALVGSSGKPFILFVLVCYG